MSTDDLHIAPSLSAIVEDVGRRAAAPDHLPAVQHRTERPTVPMTILFVDVTSSTTLYARLGDVRAHALVTLCLKHVCDAVEEFKGRVVKTMGDGAMCCFPNSDAAVLAGMAMQERLESNALFSEPIEIHIGINYGDVIVDGGDVFGDAVNVAAYVCSLALRGQILITSAVESRLTPIVAKHVGAAFFASLKGGESETMLYQVAWHEDALDRTVPRLLGPPARAINFGALVLRWRCNELHVDYKRRNIILGRGNQSDVVINDLSVSRMHASIGIRRGQLCLTDKSINGTFVRTHPGVEVHVLRGECFLEGDGELSLGRDFSESEPPDVIRFGRDRRSMFRI